MHTPTAALAVVLFALGCGGASPPVEHAASDGTYEVHLVRHVGVGTSFGIVARHVSSSTTRTSIAGSEPAAESEATTITLEGRYTVLAVGPTGLPSRMRVEVRRFTVEGPAGLTSPALPPVLVMTPDGTTGEAGEPIADDVLALLSNMPSVSSPTENAPDDDAVFGTRTPQAVGASWPVDASLMAHGLADAGMVASPEAVVGHTQLVRAVTEEGQSCIVVSSQTRIGPFVMQGLPDGAEVQHAESTFEGELTLPLDPSLPALHDRSRMTVDMQLTFPTDVGPASMQMHSTDEDVRDVTLE